MLSPEQAVIDIVRLRVWQENRQRHGAMSKCYCILSIFGHYMKHTFGSFSHLAG